LFPDIYAKYNLIGHYLVPYLKVGGGLERNNFYQLSRINPFVEIAPQTANQINRYDANAGIEGQFSSKISFDLYAGRKFVTNLPLFVNDYSLPAANQFTIIYDEAIIDVIKADLAYRLDDKLNMTLSAEFLQYAIKNELDAWHLPNARASFFTFYQLNHKIVARAEVYYMGRRFAKTFDPNEGESRNFGVFARQLDGFVDVNLGLEYRWKKQLSFFLDFNNIAAMGYENWNRLPVQRFSILGGLTFSIF
jgi:outer membrane receptor protein involved in Fe transport